MNSYKIVYPKIEIVDKYYKIATNLEKKKQSNLIENQQLASLRDWLLPMLMNGQVTVRQAHGNAVKEAEEKLSDLGMVAEPSGEHNI